MSPYIALACLELILQRGLFQTKRPVSAPRDGIKVYHHGFLELCPSFTISESLRTEPRLCSLDPMATTWAHLANLREQNDQHCTSELQSYKSQVAILHCPSFCAGAQWHTEEKQGWSSIVKHLQSMCSVLGPIPESHIKEKKPILSLFLKTP